MPHDRPLLRELLTIFVIYETKTNKIPKVFEQNFYWILKV